MTVNNKEIAELVARACKLPGIEMDQHGNTLKSLGVDSLDVASVFLAVQEQYGIEVPDEEIDKLNSVDAITRYINQKIM